MLAIPLIRPIITRLPISYPQILMYSKISKQLNNISELTIEMRKKGLGYIARRDDSTIFVGIGLLLLTFISAYVRLAQRTRDTVEEATFVQFYDVFETLQDYTILYRSWLASSLRV